MIYLFEACCQYPCRAIDGACNACSKSCDGLCKFCGRICSPINAILDRPLGGYVLLSSICTILAAILAVIGLIDTKLRACGLTVLCLANIVLGPAHACFGVYLQQKLLHGLRNPGSLNSISVEGSEKPSDEQPTSRELLSRAGQILLYDVGFCIYFFVFVGSFVLNCVGLSWTNDCHGGAGSTAGLAALLMVLFAIFAVGFTFLWYFAMCCDDCCGRSLAGGRRPGAQSGRAASYGLARVIVGKSMNAPPTHVMGAPVGSPPQAGAPVGSPVNPQPGGAPAAGGRANAMFTGLRLVGDFAQAVGQARQGRGGRQQ
mmetsp:Transcript_124019/g.246965  ORF Transcript_124019/g.246965 Transcript_124019/m.246965 type:complete len:315 (-) Transcript_124019:48-992(-)